MHDRIVGKKNLEENAREMAWATPNRSHYIFVISSHVSACFINSLLAQPDDSDGGQGALNEANFRTPDIAPQFSRFPSIMCR
jgi:hypothetical protein